MSTLDQLALQYGTDKASNGHNYAIVYERYLAPLRLEPLVVVELGVWEGASLLMWADYLPNATIIGVDVDLGRVVERVHAHPRIQLLLHDCRHPFDLERVDVCIDDASHLYEQQVATLQWLKPRTNKLYAVEDCHTWFWPHANPPNAWMGIGVNEMVQILGEGAERPCHEWNMHVSPSLMILERVEC